MKKLYTLIVLISFLAIKAIAADIFVMTPLSGCVKVSTKNTSFKEIILMSEKEMKIKYPNFNGINKGTHPICGTYWMPIGTYKTEMSDKTPFLEPTFEDEKTCRCFAYEIIKAQRDSLQKSSGSL